MRYTLYLILNLLFFSSIAQTSNNLNLIVTVDEELMISLSGLRVKVISDAGSTTHMLRYLPGKVTLSKQEFEDVFLSKNSEIILSFTGGFYRKKRYYQRYYSIPLNLNWLKEEYLVLSIYNLDTKKYRRKFSGQRNNKANKGGNNYFYSIIKPSGEIINLNNR